MRAVLTPYSLDFLFGSGLWTVLGFLAGLALLVILARRLPLTVRETLTLVLASLTSGLVIARGTHFLFSPGPKFIGQLFTFWEGGYALGQLVPAGCMGLLLTGAYLRQKQQRSGRQMGDLFAPCLAVWCAALQLDAAATNEQSGVYLFSALAFLVLGAASIRLWRQSSIPGRGLILFLIGFAIIFLVRDGVRKETLRLGGLLTIWQFYALGALVLVGVYFLVQWIDARITRSNTRSPQLQHRLANVLAVVGGVLALVGLIGLQLGKILRSWIGDAVLLVALLGAGGLLLGRFLLLRSRQADVWTLQKTPSGPLVVYLRSFTEDRRYLATLLEGLDTVPLTEEETLRAVFLPFGSLLAIGNPKDLLQPPGAARAYLGEDADWQSTVRAWTSEAEIVLVQAGASEGLRWEILHVLWTVPADRILFLFTFRGGRRQRQQAYAEFREFIQPYLPAELPVEIRQARFLSFDPDWTPRLHGPESLSWLLRWCARMNHDRVLLYQQILRPFFRRHGHWVPVWNPRASDVVKIGALIVVLLILFGTLGFLGCILWWAR